MSTDTGIPDGEKILRAVRDVIAATDLLRALKIVRTNRPLHTELAEWIVWQLVGGELATSSIQSGWDIMSADNRRVQVKAHCKAASNTTKWTRVTQFDFDQLVIVVFDPSMRIKLMKTVASDRITSSIKESTKVSWNSAILRDLCPNTASLPVWLQPFFIAPSVGPLAIPGVLWRSS